MNPKISVIVPVYNIVKFLPRCVDSIMQQSFREFELLLVDDGSNDGSGALCDDYACRDSRIRVLHKPNGGVSSARNTGLENAFGEYVQFIDGDDYVEGPMFELLYAQAHENGADIIVTDFYRDGCCMAQSLSGNSGLSLLTDMFHGKVMGALWNKFIKREVLKYLCDERLSYCEDFHLLTRILLNCKMKVYHLNQAFYHYELHPGSLTNSICKKGIERIEAYIECMESLLVERPEFLPFLDNNQLYMRVMALKGKLFSWAEYQKRFPNQKTRAILRNRQIPISPKLAFCLSISCFYPGWLILSNILYRKK